MLKTKIYYQINFRVTSKIFLVAAFSLVLVFLLSQRQDFVTNSGVVSTSYIVQAVSLEQALGTVKDVGGEITHELGIINAVGANLTPSQVEFLRQVEGVKVLENGRVRIAAQNLLASAPPSLLAPNIKSIVADYDPEAYHTSYVEATKLHSKGIEGSGVTVAVIDSGYWPNPALDYNSNNQGRVLMQYDAITDQKVSDGLPTVANDDNGHGTYVTSVLMSSETGIYGSHGVAPMANLVSVKAFGADGSGSYIDVIRGIDFVVKTSRI